MCLLLNVWIICCNEHDQVTQFTTTQLVATPQLTNINCDINNGGCSHACTGPGLNGQESLQR